MKYLIVILCVFGSLNMNAQCKIDIYQDEYTGRSQKSVNIMVRGAFRMLKVVKSDNGKYYLRGIIGGAVGKLYTGFHVKFTDGTVWNRPDADVDFGRCDHTGCAYEAFELLTADDVQIFNTKTISGWKIGVQKQNLSNGKGNKFRVRINCLTR